MISTTLKKLKRALLRRRNNDDGQEASLNHSNSRASMRRHAAEQTPWGQRNRFSVSIPNENDDFAKNAAKSGRRESSAALSKPMVRSISPETVAARTRTLAVVSTARKDASSAVATTTNDIVDSAHKFANNNGPSFTDQKNDVDKLKSEKLALGNFITDENDDAILRPRVAHNRKSVLGFPAIPYDKRDQGPGNTSTSTSTSTNSVPPYLALYAAAASRARTETGSLTDSSPSGQIARSAPNSRHASPLQVPAVAKRTNSFSTSKLHRPSSIGASGNSGSYRKVPAYALQLPVPPQNKQQKSRMTQLSNAQVSEKPLGIVDEELSGDLDGSTHFAEDSEPLCMSMRSGSPRASLNSHLTERACTAPQSPLNDSSSFDWLRNDNDIYMIKSGSNGSQAVLMNHGHIAKTAVIDKPPILAGLHSRGSTMRRMNRKANASLNDPSLLEEFPWVDFGDSQASAAEKNTITWIKIPESTPRKAVDEMCATERWEKLERTILRRQGVITIMPDLKHVCIDGGSDRARGKASRFVKKFLAEYMEKYPAMKMNCETTFSVANCNSESSSSKLSSDESYTTTPATSPRVPENDGIESESVYVFYA